MMNSTNFMQLKRKAGFSQNIALPKKPYLCEFFIQATLNPAGDTHK